MVWFQSPGNVPGQYFVVAPSQTTAPFGNTGKTGDFLEALIVTGAGVVTLFDGTTNILSFTGVAAPTRVEIRAYSKTGSWNITTAAGVSVIAIGQFS